MRIIDHAIIDGVRAPLEDGVPDDPIFNYVRGMNFGAPVFVIENVYEYWCGLLASENKPDNVQTAFPNLAPPFREFWMEFRMAADRGFLFGFQYHDNDTGGWDVEITVFAMAKHVVFIAAYLQMRVDAQGKMMVRIDDAAPAQHDYIKFWLYNGDRMSEKERRENYSAIASSLSPALLSISFMHCKNVARSEVAQPHARKFLKRTGTALVRYRVLVIEPMKRVLRTEGGVHEHGIERALHICRGHFATYTAEKPLFGRVTGMVWRPQHIRGSAAHGVVLKDYEIKT